jgi:uncharacterized repeat protein (TIGR01451 family)
MLPPQAKVGDTITWEITISNLSDPDNVPFGVVTVQDILPSEFTMGTNAPSAGGYSDGNWTFTLDSDTPTYTLTITGIAQTSGIIDNVATLTNYDPNNCGEDGSVGLCGGDPGYGDSNSTNDSDQAYVNIASIPVSVVTTSSVPLAPNTGFTVGYTSPWQDLAFYSISAASLFGLAYVTRRFTRK